MLAKVKSAAVVGLEGRLVDVEVDIASGLPTMTNGDHPLKTGASFEHDSARYARLPQIWQLREKGLV